METTRPTPPRSKEYWNNHARSFPRFEEGEDNYEAGVMRQIKAHGVDFRNASVLDVGCGSGMYTIRIAKEAARVKALDISDVMLDILREDAEARGLHNIDYLRSEWMDYDGDETFDIVFCSMTPAIQSEESRLKLLRHAAGVTIFMGFAGLMESDVMTGLYAPLRSDTEDVRQRHRDARVAGRTGHRLLGLSGGRHLDGPQLPGEIDRLL